MSVLFVGIFGPSASRVSIDGPVAPFGWCGCELWNGLWEVTFEGDVDR